MLGGTAGRGSQGDDDIDLETYEFGGHGGELVDRSVRPPRHEDDVLSLDITEFGETLANAVKVGAHLRGLRGAAEQEAYPRDFRILLSARHERPGCHAGKN
jgi:hypothetical protein